MFELHGKYGSAKIFTDVIDQSSISQIMEMLNQQFTEGQRVRIMPDVHAGKGCTIGTTMTITDKAVPNLVGVDIGCGMDTMRLKEKDIDLEKLDKLIYAVIPSGFAVRSKPHQLTAKTDLTKLYCFEHISHDRALLSIGTLGGGNHFIEADRDDDGNVYIVVHSGSRHLGREVAEYYQRTAYDTLNCLSAEEKNSLIEELKRQGKSKQIESELNKLRNVKRTDIPKALAYTEGSLFEQYIHDMKIVQAFAVLNRKAMLEEIVKGMGVHIDDCFTTIHNYIDTENMILRKGAVSAQRGETLLIPINMRDGSLICTGKGNPDWNCSAPHGAGRLLSRSEAKKTLTVKEFKEQMKGIFTTSVGSATLDESPMAYKSMEDITSNIGDTAEIEKVIRPIYNFKAGEA